MNSRELLLYFTAASPDQPCAACRSSLTAKSRLGFESPRESERIRHAFLSTHLQDFHFVIIQFAYLATLLSVLRRVPYVLTVCCTGSRGMASRLDTACTHIKSINMKPACARPSCSLWKQQPSIIGSHYQDPLARRAAVNDFCMKSISSLFSFQAPAAFPFEK